MKKALITGLTGQDGAYLLRLLLKKDYEIHAIKRRTSTFSTTRIDEIYNNPEINEKRVFVHHGDLNDGLALYNIMQKIQPDEVYNLAAQSHVGVSFENPVSTVTINCGGTINLLEAVRYLDKPCRFFQASSSEMFGSTPPPQNEASLFRPRSPYACSKVFCYYQVVNYREAYSLCASNGILFNHESPLRGENFVTRKVTRAAARIKMGLLDKVTLGNLDAYRDWGYAPDFVEAMWLIMQQDKPDDYVVATGEMHSVRELCEICFSVLGLDYRDHVVTHNRYLRPTDVAALRGDASKAKEKLGWEPKITFKDLVELMVENDLVLATEEKKIGRFISMF